VEVLSFAALIGLLCGGFIIMIAMLSVLICVEKVRVVNGLYYFVMTLYFLGIILFLYGF